MLLTFKEFFLEARSHPELNPKISAYKALEPYKNNPDIYISFTEIKKIGIKPLSEYNTPNGVYTYPLKEFWKKYGVDKYKSISKAAPFAGDRPYIFILKSKNKPIFIEDMYKNYTSKDFDRDMKKIKDMYYEYAKKSNDIMEKDVPELFRADMNLAINSAKDKNPVMSFWNFTKRISENITTLNRSKFLSSTSETQAWNNLLRRLGYTGFGDKSGRGYIHPSEPTQAVFLSRDAFDVIDMIENREETSIITSPGKGNIFQGDLWEKGIWVDGIWVDGIWKSGIWKNGIWKNGYWKNGTWEDGIWLNGECEDIIWENGTWRNGIWNTLTWGECIWKNGTWKKGEWKDGEWKNGIWENGTWLDGTWRNGIWKNGKWEFGTWENGNWENGIWKDGLWKNGIWKNGEWKDGTWMNGNWISGNWKIGKITSYKFMKNIISSKDPKTFHELEKQAKTIEELEKLVK